MESSKGVVIIGAGFSGLALALALSAHSIPCTIYESRAESYDQGGAIMLSPNALRILDNLGVYQRIRPKGFSFETLVFRNAAGELTDKYYFGHEEKYGYKALRVYRYILIEALTSLLGDRGVPIHYSSKFSSITSESSEGGSTITFSDGSSTTAALVIGADGIHSKVRSYLDPTSIPTYSGLVAITTAVEKSSLRLPSGEEYPMPVSISAKNGAFVMAPQDFHGDELLAGTQFAVPERGRFGWDNFTADKEGLLGLMRSKKEEWPQIVQFALEGMTKEKMSAWPFYVVPRIEKWFSDKGRVVLVGDAAHAIPPTTGQGVNQAFEDVYTLSLLLSEYTDMNLNEASWTTGLQNWQKGRQERIDKILDLTRRMNNKRLPAVEQEKLADGEVWHGEEGEAAIGEMGWLYGADLKEMAKNWTGKGL